MECLDSFLRFFIGLVDADRDLKPRNISADHFKIGINSAVIGNISVLPICFDADLYDIIVIHHLIKLCVDSLSHDLHRPLCIFVSAFRDILPASGQNPQTSCL